MERIDVGCDGLRVEVADGIGWVWFVNPDRANALTREMMAALPRAAEALAGRRDVAVVVLRGEGDRAFVAGADIGELGSGPSAPRADAMTRGIGAHAVAELDIPVIAMINGHCIGGGVILALAADIRLASTRATFGIPPSKLGVAYPLEAVQALVDLVGPAHAAELLYTGTRIEAAEAERIGLVNRAVAADDLDAAVRATAEQIAANAPLSISAATWSLRASVDPAHTDRAQEAIAAAWSSTDASEGARAFLDKRPPRWQGR